MALTPTGDIIQACPLPPTMNGTPQEWFDEYTKRLTIVSATGRGRIVISDSEPTDSQAVWIRGTEILLFDAGLKRFVPIDISASETKWFWTGSTIPPNSTPPTWLRTSAGATRDTPPDTSYGRALGFYQFDGSVWRPFSDIPNSGTSADRPANPLDLEKFWDTTIATEIIWERGQWRTVSGQPGDIKATGHTSLAIALQFNPGWALLGAGNASLRGRLISGATRDQDGSNPLTTDANVPPRSVGETFGENQGLTGAAPLTITLPPSVAFYLLTKE